MSQTASRSVFTPSDLLHKLQSRKFAFARLSSGQMDRKEAAVVRRSHWNCAMKLFFVYFLKPHESDFGMRTADLKAVKKARRHSCEYRTAELYRCRKFKRQLISPNVLLTRLFYSAHLGRWHQGGRPRETQAHRSQVPVEECRARIRFRRKSLVLLVLRVPF